MNTKLRVKSYEQIKREQEAVLKQKKKAINDVLTSAKNNPKFAKLLSYSFTSIDKMITPPNSDARLNAKLIIEGGGIEILRNIAQKNIHNEDLLKHIANILVKLTSLHENTVDQELAQKFVENKGHEAVIQILLAKNKGPSSVPLIRCLNNLCQVPQLINKLLNAGLAEAIKVVNDSYTDDITALRLNLDTMKKVSNQKNGRDVLIKKGIVPSILSTVKQCSERNDPNSVLSGLTVVDNLCRNEDGKKEVKNANAPNIFCEIVENFSESAKIINKSAKILAKIMTKKDLEKELEKLKNCSAKLDKSDNQDIINEAKDSLCLISNLMLVDELGKIVCLPQNFDMLMTLYNKLSKIDLINKKPGYVKDYMQNQKDFLTLFKRGFDNKPEYLDEDESGSETYTILMDTVNESLKNDWENTKSNIEKLEKEGDKDGDLVPLKNAFKNLFSSYCDILKQRNDKKSDENKGDPKWIELLNYLVGEIIVDGKTIFGEDEKANYSASNVLKIADDVVTNYPDECLELPKNIKKCFPYMKGVIGFSDNWKTLKNDLDVIYNTIKDESDESELKKDIIPVITDFMDDKYKFRQPNLTNLNILDDYLKPEFVAKLRSKKPDVKSNPNLGLDYVSAIDSVMAKPFYPSLTLLKEVGTVDELEKEKEEDEDLKEPKNEEVEKKIIAKGTNLLKRLIPPEEFVKQVNDFKKNANAFNPDTSKAEDIMNLQDNLIYQVCALNCEEFFNLGMNDDFKTLSDLIKKEINYIESFKRLKSNENNPKYKEICDASNKRLHLQLGTLRKLEDQGIDKYGKTKNDKYGKLLKDIIGLNSEIINKSTDSPNLKEHLTQLRNNVGFLRDNEKELSDDKNKTPSEEYINSLMKLLNKSINDEDLCDSIIKTLIAFANKKPGICNLLVKLGCPRLLLQIKDKTQNKQLANDAMELLKMITLSSKENAEVIGNQNILLKLFEIRSKFASVDEIINNTDQIANELMKLPGQGKFAQSYTKDAIKEFHENVQKDFKNDEVKQKILNNEEVINSFTSNKEAIKPILEKEFIKDLTKACDLATKDPEVSITIDKLLTNDMGLLKKIKDNLPTKDDPRHKDVVNNTFKILLDKANFEEPLLLSCKLLSDYVKDDVLYNKHLSDKVNENLVDKLIEIQDNYLDTPEITKEINNILCYLALRSPKLAEYIIKKGGLAQVIEELKAVANLNDPTSKLLKLNGLKMLNSLLNNSKNLDKFLDAGGVDLINKIVKNEVDNTPKSKDEENSLPEDKYLTIGTICTKTPEQLQEEEKLGINSFTKLGLNKEEADKKRDQLLNDLNDDKSKGSTSSGEDNSDDSDNYFVQCLKIINKGLNNGKKEFVDDKTVQNLTNLATVNFPDKHLFSEVATILSNKDVKLNPDATDNLRDLMKLAFSSKAQYYGDGNVGQKVKAIEAKIANMLMNNLRFKAGLKNAIRTTGLNEKPIPGKLSDDRWGDMPKRADDDDRPLPGKLKDDRWGDMGRRNDDDRPLPGKLKDDRWGDMGRRNDDDRPLPGKLKDDRWGDMGKRKDDDRPLPGKLKDDRWGDMGKRKDDDRPLPGKLNDNRFGDMGKRNVDDRPLPGKLKNPFDGKVGKGGKSGIIPGKLKNRFGNNPKEKLGLNKYPGQKKGEKGEKTTPALDNKKEGKKKKGIELFDKNGNIYNGTYNKLEHQIEKYDLYDKYGNRLDGTYQKVTGNTKVYDKNNKNVDPSKKDEKSVEPVVGYNQFGNKLDGLFSESQEEPTIPLFDKKGNKMHAKYKKVGPETPLINVYDINGNKLEGTFKKYGNPDEPENELFDKYGNQLFSEYKKDLNEPSEELYDKMGKKVKGKFKKLVTNKLSDDAYDKSLNKVPGTFRKIESPIKPIDLYDKNGKKLDGKYISPISCVPSKELFDKNKKKVEGIFRKVEPNIPGVDAYDINGNKLKGTYKNVEDDAPGEEIYDKDGAKLFGKYRNVENDTPGIELFDKSGKKLDGKYKKVVGDPSPKEVFDKSGNKLDGTYRKILSDLPGEELFNKNGNKLDDKYINIVSSLPEEEYYDKNKKKIEGIYKKDDPEDDEEELFDEDGYQLDGSYKKILLNDPNEELYDKNGKKLDKHYRKVLSDIPGIDVFDKNGNKLKGKYANVISDFPSEEVFDKKGNKAFGLFRKIDSDKPYEEAYDQNGNKLDGVYIKADSGPGLEIYDKNGKKLDGKYTKIKSDVPEDQAYDQYGNKLDGTYKKNVNGEPGDDIYDKNGNKLKGTYRKLEKDSPSIELFDKNKKKLNGTYKRIIEDAPKEELYDKNGNKLEGTYRKIESDLPGMDVYDKNKNKLDDKYANVISNLPQEPIFDKNKNRKNAIYRKVESDTPVEEAYDKLGNKLNGSYKRAANDEPGFELYDQLGNKLDGYYKKVDSDSPSIEIFDKNGYKLDGTYKKIIDDDPNEQIFDKNGNKLDSKYRKVLSDIPGDYLYDKNGNLLDGKYIDILSNIPTEEVFDKKGNKAWGLFRKIEPETPGEELFDKNGNKMDGTFRKAEDGEPGIEGYNKKGNKLRGRFIPNESRTPGEELYDKNKKKLDGTYERIVLDSPKDDVFDRFGNKLNGTYRKLQSDLPGIDAFDKNKNKLNTKYAKIISNLPNNEIYDKNGKKLRGVYRKNNLVPGKLNDDRFAFMGRRSDDDDGRPIPGKLNDDRWGDMGRRADDDDGRPLPGKLNDDRWGDMGRRADDDDGRPLPGKLKNPFDGQGKDRDNNRNIPGKLKRQGEQRPGEDRNKNKPGKKSNVEKNPEENAQDKNKLLTYLSLATEPEALKNVFADANPEICSFFGHLNSSYKPVIDKILKDKENKINDLNKNLLDKNERGENPTILEPFNINSLPEKEQYDEGVVLSLAKLYNYILKESDNNGNKRPLPGKLNDDRWGDMGRRADDDDGRPLPGKLKNPFDGKGKPGDNNRPIPGKLKNPFDGQGKDDDKNRKIPGKLKKNEEGGKEKPGLNEYKGKGKKDGVDKYKNLLDGNLTPEDPINNEFVNNIEILADPVYTPDNYIFVKQFNDQMDKVMNNLGKYGEQPSDEEKIEVTENYLSHLNNLFNKAVPFLHDLHKEINNSATGHYPKIRKEKEENLDTILNATEEYYKTDEDSEIKADATKNLCDACLNLIDDLSKDGIVDPGSKDKVKEINKRLNKLWKIVNNVVKNDENNQLLEPNNTNNMRDLLKKLDDSINNKGLNDKVMREIPYNLSTNLENGEDQLAQDLLDFAMKDLEKHGNENEEIKDLNLQTLTNLSQFPGLMKQIMKNPKVWDMIKKQYLAPNVTLKKRELLSNLFNNASKSNYNIEHMINNDPQGIKAILDKMINNPVKTLDDGGQDIAESEVDTLCNILKDRNNYKALTKGDLLKSSDVNKLENLYKNLDPKIGEPLKPIVAQIKEADKSKREKDDVKEDEKQILELDKKVGNCFQMHKKALLKYAGMDRSDNKNEKPLPGKLDDDRWGDMGRSADDDRPLPGKLKNPFDGKGKPGDNNRPIPGKLKRNNEQGNDNDLLRKASSLRKMSFISGALLLHQADNAKIKSSLSSKENPEIAKNLNNILSLLRKNYNDMKSNDNPELNVKRADNIHKCLNLLKELSLAPDNHKPILEGGFMNFMEQLDNDYKLFKNNGEPDLNNKNLGFAVDGKNVLQACSNSENAIPIIAKSPIFDSTINEVTKLYEKPEIIAANSDIQTLFKHDNVIFSNLCKNKNVFDEIFSKMGLDKLLELGKKTGNVNLLDSILNMVKNYVKNTPDKSKIPPKTLDSIFEIMNKCESLNDRHAPLMSKVLDLGDLLYTDKLKPRVDNLNLINSMNNDIDKFKGNHGYINSCLGSLNTLTKDNPKNGKEAIDSGLIKKLNDQVSTIVKEGPEKYEQNRDNNEEDENGYLKTCLNLSRLYNTLVHNDINNVDKFNKMGITDDSIKMLGHFNDKVEPKTEEEKEAELNRKRNLAALNKDENEEDIDDFTPKELVRGIMRNNAQCQEQITLPPASNDYLANKTNFGDTINKTLENDDNEPEYLKSASHALANHLVNGNTISKIDVPKNYKICKNLQSNYYSDPEILTNVNTIAGAMVKNLKDDNKGKEYTKKYYDLIPENLKAQDYNPDFVLNSLKLMHDSLVKKPYLINDVYEETVPNVLNLMKLYKDNPEIQEKGFKLLSLFARSNVISSSMLTNGLLDVMKDNLTNPNLSKNNLIDLKSELFQLVNCLSQDKENCSKIADELMGDLIGDLNEKGYKDEGKIIAPLLDNLCKNKDCIPAFVQYNGIDTCIDLLNNNDSNIELISNVFGILKNIAEVGDEYKKILQDKKVPDIINRIVKKVGPYDKKLENEGRQLIFNVNLCQVQLEDPNSIEVKEIKIIEPIPPEVRNFLTNGKQVKIINNNGDVKQMQLIFAQDLLKVSAKKIKSNLPPKPKYIIDTITIKKILKGHGTDAFKKCKGLFKKMPPPEICFSIIGPTTVDGTKSLNVECESEKEVDKWIQYLQIVINYFKKTNAIKGTVLIKK